MVGCALGANQYILAQSNSNVHHTHTATPGGGFVDIYSYADGTTQTVTSMPCTNCGQTGVCSWCHGAGQTFVAAGPYSRYVPCILCHMTGKCSLCGGNGMQVMVVWGNTNTGAYTGIGNNGFATSGYIDNSSSSFSPSSSSSSSSSFSSSSSSRPYVEVKQYAPDYTGNASKVWCDKCQKWDYPHVHVKKYH